MNKTNQPLIFGIFFLGLIALLAIGSQPGSGQTSDELLYLPQVRLDPSPTPTMTPTPTATPSCSYDIIDSADSEIEDAIMAEIQKVRSDENQSELTRLDEIIHAARLHSEDMAIFNYVTHIDSKRKYAPDRLEAVCYIIEEDQEVVWGGTYEDAESLVAAWLENKFWKSALLDEDIVDFGVGYIKGIEGSTHADYFTVNLARRQTTRAHLSNQQSCEIPLENEYGSGTLKVVDTELCNDYFSR
ncbi:MAG: CAP domain-containing protein [Anaerolineae bacterium]